jgi:hypothetical protein
MTARFDAEALARDILVRHREPGYVRFQLPPPLAAGGPGQAIVAGLRALPGVYRVTLYASDRKLSVFYDPFACALADVARALLVAVRDAPAGVDAAAADTAAAPGEPGRLRQWLTRQSDQLREKTQQWRAQGRLVMSLVRAQARSQPMLRNALGERAVVNFLNDIVAFYLIKVHWDLITQRWMKAPFANRSAWLATFYLVFLLVRYRKGGARPALPAPKKG